MLGTKATFLDTLSKKIGYEYLRFDYSGHGSSEGKIEKQLLSDWVNESYLLIKKKLNHPVIIVGSSLGGWIAFILLKKFKKNILGIIGIGAAPDFTNNIIKSLSSIQKKDIWIKAIYQLKVITEKNLINLRKSLLKILKKFCLIKKFRNKY